jgi:O-antigen/teichoic acid export membrane protein
MTIGSPEKRRMQQRRDRQALKTASAGLVVHVLGHAIGFVVIPLSLHLLGVELYGLWLAVGSLLAMAAVTDFALSPGLVNLVATASGRGDRELMRRYVSTAFMVYAVLASIVVLAVTLLAQWSRVPDVVGARDPDLVSSARALVQVCGVVFAATTLTRIIPTVCAAVQEGYYAAWAHLAGRLVSLAALLSLLQAGGSVVSYALAIGLPPLLAEVALGAFVFGRRHRDLRPRMRCCDSASLRALWCVGGFLALHQFADLTVLYSANLLIANRLGSDAVPHYSVPYALFFALTSAAWLIASPYMAAYGEASARGDWDWIRRRAFHVLATTTVLLAAGGAVLVVIGSDVVHLWTGGQVRPATDLLAALSVLCLFKAISNTINVILIGLGLVRAVAFTHVAVAGIYVVGTWLLLPIFGLIVVPLANTGAHLLGIGILAPYTLQKLRASAPITPRGRLRELAATGRLTDSPL